MFKKLNDLKLHDSQLVEEIKNGVFYEITTVRRVPGGWIYTTTSRNLESKDNMLTNTSVFVPYAQDIKE